MKPNMLLLGCVLALAAPLASAETLLVDRVGVEAGKNLPARGISMAQVEAKYGAPAKKFDAVGGGSRQTPPITRWVYPGFSVYFENRHVIDAVLNKAGPNEIGPAPARPE